MNVTFPKGQESVVSRWDAASTLKLEFGDNQMAYSDAIMNKSPSFQIYG